MKFTLFTLLVLAAYAQARILEEQPITSAYNYLAKSVALADRRRQIEEEYIRQQRVIGGSPAALGQIPWQAGLLIQIPGVGTGVCGASLISPTRLTTAAHCYFDGVNQAAGITVRLGTILIFGNDGITSVTTNVRVHPSWFPWLVRNDVAVIILHNAVSFTNTVAPITLPIGSELDDSFAGSVAIVSGFGLTAVGGGVSNNLQHNALSVISNLLCATSFVPLLVHSTNICTSGVGIVGACNGDSGGPLFVNRAGRNILIGIVSFGPPQGCEAGLPTVYARATSFTPWIQEQL